MRINEVLGDKPSAEVVTIAPDASVRDLLALLAEHNVGAVVVSSDGAAVDGIVSERDVVRRLHDDEDGPRRHGGPIMTSDVETCEPDTTVDELRCRDDRAPDPARAGRHRRSADRHHQHR